MSKKNKWKRFRPNSNDEIESLLRQESILTRRWYERISGAVEWTPGEQRRLNATMDALAEQIGEILRESSAEWFAGLPD